MEARQAAGGVGAGWASGVGREVGLTGEVGLLHKAAGVCWPNNSVEPTALSWCFARLAEPATTPFSGVVPHRSGGGSPRSR